jgi:hypothetical protein
MVTALMGGPERAGQQVVGLVEDTMRSDPTTVTDGLARGSGPVAFCPLIAGRRRGQTGDACAVLPTRGLRSATDRLAGLCARQRP